MSAIVEAGLRHLWRSPVEQFPAPGEVHPWEVWLNRKHASEFINDAAELGIELEEDRLDFPEDLVVVAHASHEDLAIAVKHSGVVRALATPAVPSAWLVNLPSRDQQEWIQHLSDLVQLPKEPWQHYVTLLDTGIGLNHPLIQPFLEIHDRFTAMPAWDVDDHRGHGTQMAGLALFGDLAPLMAGMHPVAVGHRLESSKIVPDAGANPHHLLGAMVRNGINAVETTGDRSRTFVMASTTEDDTPHDGAPTSWSTEMDQLASGASGINQSARLIVVAAGNTDQNQFQGPREQYLQTCDQSDHEIESPAQAWNPVCVGAYTTKTLLPAGTPGQAVAPSGDLSPNSRTASWSSHWPIKPDVVMEGGNWVLDGAPPPMRHEALSLLTTDHRMAQGGLTSMDQTSAAAALAAKALTEIWREYPHLWPETVRALFVSSARWTAQMTQHLPQTWRKSDLATLFRRYGYGVPDLARARHSASNAFSLIVQDTITPYRSSDARNGDPVHNEMKVFHLPWPQQELRRLGTAQITLRVALSTFVEPNPSEAARGSKYRYASHNLRFKLNRPNETEDQFRSRINFLAARPDVPAFNEEDGWTFGVQRRDVGSLQVDELCGPASDLAQRNLLAVHPVGGWWKSKLVAEPKPEHRTARFALVIDMDAGETDVDLYAEVSAAVAASGVTTLVS